MEEIKQYNDYEVYLNLREENRETIDNYMQGNNNEGMPISNKGELKSVFEKIHYRVLQVQGSDRDSFLKDVIEPQFTEILKRIIRYPVET